METNLFTKWCRICSTESVRGYHLFGDEAKRMFLDAKIRRYLNLTITVDDRLPKIICEDCCKKIETFHKFATMAIRNQETMTKFICNNTNILDERTAEKSLLHTYLTKGIREIQETEVTEVEVRIDPMTILQCNEDETETKETDDLSLNNEDDDSDDDVNSCPICGKEILPQANLKVHLETHRPKGKYGCDICGRIFKTQCNLHRHKEYHEGVQYPCGVCGRVYPTNSTLRAHSITHSDLRPHKCPLCDKTFKRNQDLKFHINQHTGARPYQCPYCPKAFASSGNCFSHRKRMHPIEVERDREKAARIMR